MEPAVEQILQWAREGTELAPPTWEQLPGIPLYVDQVLLYLKDTLRFFERDSASPLLTNSMINNYVKSGALPHPEKKKYGKQHLAALVTICMLKQDLALQDIITLLDGQELDPQMYELFRAAHTAAVQETCRELAESCQSGENPRHQALRLAAEANAKRAAAERILCELEKAEAKGKKA